MQKTIKQPAAVTNHAISDKYDIVTSSPRHHVPGMGDIDLRHIDLITADRLFARTKGLLALKQVPDKASDKVIPKKPEMSK